MSNLSKSAKLLAKAETTPANVLDDEATDIDASDQKALARAEARVERRGFPIQGAEPPDMRKIEERLRKRLVKSAK
jgi:hypothetical protein